jgi:hypothetical protein
VTGASGSAADPDGDDDVHGASRPRDSASLSSAGQFLSQLQQLQSQDPAKLKEILTGIAGQFQSAAKQAGQTPEGQLLTNLANSFQKAADTGDLSALQPQQASGHHHVHHRRYQQGAGGAGQSPLAALSSQTTASGGGSSAGQILSAALAQAPTNSTPSA